MFNFKYFAPTEVCFGRGTVDSVGEYVKKYHGTKVLEEDMAQIYRMAMPFAE